MFLPLSGPFSLILCSHFNIVFPIFFSWSTPQPFILSPSFSSAALIKWAVEMTFAVKWVSCPSLSISTMCVSECVLIILHIYCVCTYICKCQCAKHTCFYVFSSMVYVGIFAFLCWSHPSCRPEVLIASWPRGYFKAQFNLWWLIVIINLP